MYMVTLNAPPFSKAVCHSTVLFAVSARLVLNDVFLGNFSSDTTMLLCTSKASEL